MEPNVATPEGLSIPPHYLPQNTIPQIDPILEYIIRYQKWKNVQLVLFDPQQTKTYPFLDEAGELFSAPYLRAVFGIADPTVSRIDYWFSLSYIELFTVLLKYCRSGSSRKRK